MKSLFKVAILFGGTAYLVAHMELKALTEIALALGFLIVVTALLVLTFPRTRMAKAITDGLGRALWWIDRLL